MTCETVAPWLKLFGITVEQYKKSDMTYESTGTWKCNTYTSKGSWTFNGNSGEWIMKGWYYCDPDWSACMWDLSSQPPKPPTSIGQWKITLWQKSKHCGKCWYKVDFSEKDAWQFFMGAMTQTVTYSLATGGEESNAKGTGT